MNEVQVGKTPHSPFSFVRERQRFLWTYVGGEIAPTFGWDRSAWEFAVEGRDPLFGEVEGVGVAAVTDEKGTEPGVLLERVFGCQAEHFNHRCAVAVRHLSSRVEICT